MSTNVTNLTDVTHASTTTSVAGLRRLVALARDLVALTKPRITMMAGIVAAGGMSLAPGSISLMDAVLSLLGIVLAVSGAGALNMLIERDVDALMERTRERPLPAGRLDTAWALFVGGALSLVSLPLLYVFAGPLSCALTAFSLFVYVLLYTPMKRTSPWALVVGAVPGAMPALMGSAAVSNEAEIAGIALFGVVFLWQLPHFLAISIYRDREYVAAGHKIVSAVWGATAARVGLFVTALAVSAFGVALWPIGVAGPAFALVALVLGAWFTWLSVGAVVDLVRPSAAFDVNAWARKVFFASLVYITVFVVALALERVIVSVLA